MISCTCSSILKCAKKFEKMKKVMKYNKKIKIRPNLSKEFQIMFEGLIKNGGKNKKNLVP
jgi:hypothetical protein